LSINFLLNRFGLTREFGIFPNSRTQIPQKLQSLTHEL
jgi:hypothetical protein